MFELTEPLKLLLALVLGGVIGLEREAFQSNTKLPKNDALLALGVRTFSLISSIGCLSGLMFQQFQPFSLLVSAAFFILILIYYVLGSMQSKDIGFTTELAIVITYIIGFLIALEVVPVSLVVAITTVLILVVSQKEKIKRFTNDLQKREINAFVGFAIIALVILPFLPNETYMLSDIPFVKAIQEGFSIKNETLSKIEILNPFKLWFIVALITGIDIAGYILEKTIGAKKGLLATSLVGGFISSTATIVALASQSKHIKNSSSHAGFALLANAISYFPIVLLIATINSAFLLPSFPALSFMFLGSVVCGVFFLKFHHSKTKHKNEFAKSFQGVKIFDLFQALKFAGIFLVIRIVTKASLALFGTAGLFVSSAIAATTGIDAVTINIAELVGKSIEPKTAVIALIIVNAVNVAAKTVYSFLQGNRQFAFKFGIGALITIGASLLSIMSFPV